MKLSDYFYYAITGYMTRLGMILWGDKGDAPAPDPNIGLAQMELANLSREQLAFWKSEVWPTMQANMIKQEARADEQFAIDRALQQRQTQIAETEYKRLTEQYYPLQDDVIRDAKEYNTESKREQLASEAMGDVRQQFALSRDMQRMSDREYGIDPTSGRAAGMENANRITEAATAAAAANKTRQAAEQLGWAKRMDAIGLGMGQFGNQATSTGLALTAGNQALNSGQVAINNLGAASQMANQSYGGAMQGWSSVGTLGVQKYNADVNAWSAGQQAKAAAVGALAQAGGSAAGIYAAKKWA